MAFYGCSFTFDGVACTTYDLMMYDIGGESQGDTDIAGVVEPVEETIGVRPVPYFYGAKFTKKLQFNIVFGVNNDRIDDDDYLTRDEIEDIAKWLTGHDQYKWLTIAQSDMSAYRYKCMITNLEVVEFGNIPYALRAVVTCDGPFAYRATSTSSYTIDGPTTITYNNLSSSNTYFMPTFTFEIESGNSLSIVNNTDGGREMKFENIPGSIGSITVDCDHCIISDDQDINLYPNFNNKFLRLKRGNNTLVVTGKGTLTFTCDFYANIGG